MSFTIRGFEVTEVSYTAWNATTAYCACLRTQRPRLERDLRRVTAEHIGHARTTLQDVQAVLHHLFAISVVLVGPGWEIYGRRFERGQCTVEDAGRCLQPWRSLVSLNDADLRRVLQAGTRGQDGRKCQGLHGSRVVESVQRREAE
ncbi:hypothetical protein HPB48_021855 [Haemaphysalis longicornis]|uniref:Uncharacterized protein n=1 Tax=Haemaphysalis longicornis TaxID=44386 RepID=A0A9J6H3C2_HAELO|nr:hypothetical protein HPB48_021855 [Haemaphysalis longicornis]